MTDKAELLALAPNVRRFDRLLRSVAEPGPNTRWLESNRDSLARIRAEQDAEHRAKLEQSSC